MAGAAETTTISANIAATVTNKTMRFISIASLRREAPWWALLSDCCHNLVLGLLLSRNRPALVVWLLVSGGLGTALTTLFVTWRWVA
jgi:hypothetical protein